MKHIHEPARNVPVLAETDLLVVGSGPGGLSAAISAARAGVKTMLVDRYGCFGGVISQVGVEGIAWYRSDGTTDVEGIGREFEARAKAMGGTRSSPKSKGELLNAELFKVLADNLVREAGVEPLLHSLAVESLVEDNVMRGVIVENKSGRQALLAKVVIDATGDADVAYRAGAACRKTPREEMMGVTVMFSCIGVDKARFLEYVKANPKTYRDWGKEWQVQTTGKEDDLPTSYLDEPFEQARQAGVIPESIKSIGGTWGAVTDSGEATYMNMVYLLGYDSTDVHDLTKAEIEGRYQAMLTIEALKRYAPGFEKAGLRNFGMTLGTRDSRKIIGRYNLTEHDVRNQARFDDSIGIFPEFIDGYGVLVLPTTGRYFQVPYGILVPEKIDNLLVAGRCVAGDKISHGALRNQMGCTVTGQGAGVAAAVAIQDGVPTSQVNLDRVQSVLKQQGVRLH